MRTRNSLTALFGFWFVISPWVLGLSNLSVVVWTSVCLGTLQLCASLLALKKSKFNVLENWFTLLTGLWFAIFSINFSLSFSQTWTVGILGLLTVALVLWNMDTTL
ncbi:SPW repeat protein [Paenibacillus sp. FSL H7-0331]|jgi:hypothetical protein|uniref:SPW repeat domain-containing protein n=1 Tax=Paenibacillus sp. FSL H7-0331 TaxID=1920421 RepID=UPI00096CDF57|nr:SPW repeat protein [Paenibacillus sp. FSL H7-0331]OMF14563.1 hypothetical protein BK127_17745 [Paenibacillus sp. FSL H7-0331]